MTHYKLVMIEYLKYGVYLEDKFIGTISMKDSPGQFYYESPNGEIKGTVVEVKDAVRALRKQAAH